MKDNFNFKKGDKVLFPDTESEYADVGIGASVKVAETPVNTMCEVKAVGKGFNLEILDGYSEIFNRGIGKTISLKEYVSYFGNFDNLKLV